VARQYRVPGWGFINETLTGQYRVAGLGYLNETQSTGSVGTADGTSTASGVGVTAAVGSGSSAGTSTATGIAPSSSSDGAAAGSSTATGEGASIAASAGSAAGTSTADAIAQAPAQHSGVNYYRISGSGTINETTVRQYRIPGWGFINETQVTGFSGLASGSSTTAAVGAALSSGTALSIGTSMAGAVGAALASSAAASAGTSSATGDGSTLLARPVVCFSPVDYFNYVCLDRKANSPVSEGSAFGTSTATGSSAAIVASAASAAGTSTAFGGVDGSVISSSGTASGTSTATGDGDSTGIYELSVPGTPKVLYSTIRPTGHTGSAARIARSSDGVEIDIGWASDGRIDRAAADAHAPLGWYYVKWYELMGSGYDLTVPATTQPPHDFGNTIDGSPSMTFNGPQTIQALANTSVPWTNIRNTTFMMVMKTGSQGVLEVGNPTRKMSVIGVNDSGMNWTGTQAQALMTSPQVMLIVNNGASSRVLHQNDIVTTAAALTSSAATGITVGNAIGYGSPGSVDLLCVVGYDSTLSSGDQVLLKAAGHAIAPGIPETCNDTVVLHADSIGAGNSRGATVSAETLWFSLLQEATARDFRWYNMGHGGYTVTQLLTVADAVAAACFNPAGENIAILAAGSNDLAANATAAATYPKIVQWVNKFKAAGYSKVGVVDQIPRKAIFSNGATAASFEIQRQLLIGMIAAGAGADFDASASPGTHPILGDPANCTANTVDNIHPNPTGNGYYYDKVDADFAGLLA
jgi:hypothetical protein